MGNFRNEIIIQQSREQLKRVLIASVVMMAISIVCFFFNGSFYTVVAIAGTCFFGIEFDESFKQLLMMFRCNTTSCIGDAESILSVPWSFFILRQSKRRLPFVVFLIALASISLMACKVR